MNGDPATHSTGGSNGELIHQPSRRDSDPDDIDYRPRRRQQRHYDNGGGGNGGSNGGGTKQVAVITLLSTVASALVGWFALTQILLRPLETNHENLDARVTELVRQAENWRAEFTADVHRGFTEIRKDMESLTPEDRRVAMLTRINEILADHQAVIQGLAQRVSRLEQEGSTSARKAEQISGENRTLIDSLIAANQRNEERVRLIESIIGQPPRERGVQR